jgi:hypothetical protein
VAALLASLAAACNDASLADAQARLRRLALRRRVVGEAYNLPSRSAADPVQLATAAYVGSAARFAAATVQILSRLADGQPANVTEPQAVTPFDVVTMPLLHIPLVRIPTRCATTDLAVLAAVNVEFADNHTQLTVAVDRLLAGGGAASAFDASPHPDTAGNRPADPGGLLPQALHRYAATCVGLPPGLGANVGRGKLRRPGSSQRERGGAGGPVNIATRDMPSLRSPMSCSVPAPRWCESTGDIVAGRVRCRESPRQWA